MSADAIEMSEYRAMWLFAIKRRDPLQLNKLQGVDFTRAAVVRKPQYGLPMAMNVDYFTRAAVVRKPQ